MNGAFPPHPRRRPRSEFSPTEHLSTEAIAAFADGELSRHASHRARTHIVHCEECRREVNIQRAAAERLRACDDEMLHAPRTLLERLERLQQTAPEKEEDEKRHRAGHTAAVSSAIDAIDTALGAARRALGGRG